MRAGYDLARLLRVAAISAVLFGAFLLLRPYGHEWLVIPGGLLVAIVIILLALWRNHRTRRRIESIEREIDQLQKRGDGRRSEP